MKEETIQPAGTPEELSAERVAVLPMIVKEYIDWTARTVFYPLEREAEYLQLGLLAKAGALGWLTEQGLRTGLVADKREELELLGDCGWYLARMIPEPLLWADGMEKIGEYIDCYRFDSLLTVMASDKHALRKIAAFSALSYMLQFKPLEVLAANMAQANRKRSAARKGNGR